MNAHRILGGGREHLPNGPVQLFDHINLLDAPLTELSVAHDLRDDAVRSLDFLLNYLHLLRCLGPAFSDGLLERESRIVYDRERVFDLMRKLCREAASRTQL